jgi:hypothetical protein
MDTQPVDVVVTPDISTSPPTLDAPSIPSTSEPVSGNNYTTIIIVGVISCILILSIIIGIFYFSTSKSTSTIPSSTTAGPSTTTAGPSTTTAQPELEKLTSVFQPEINNNIAWKNMPNAGNKNMNNLNYTMQCNKPWNAYYQLGCTLKDKTTLLNKTVYSNTFGPVRDGNWQGPNIRIAADGENNSCSKLGGTISVLRRRPSDGDNMVDITPYLMNFDRTGAYNGRDPIFTDMYNIDCGV